MLSAAEKPRAALASFTGPEFEGGAKDLFGTSFAGQEVNTIYSLQTGPRSSMRAKFTVQTLTAGPLFVHLKARDDDAPKACSIAVRLNGKTVFEGPNQFSPDKFETRKLAIPENTLAQGENTLTIECREKEGSAGVPPWFQVASCAIAPENYVVIRDIRKQFSVEIPSERKPFPEPLPDGAQPGFQLRGTKGWAWTPEQYLEEIPWLVKFKMNFLMNCYLSMFDIENHANWGDGNANRWWEELSAPKKAAYAKVVRACQQQGINFCFGMNPNLASKRFIKADAPDELDALYKHYAWMQSLGVRWFNISLDDISQGIDASSHARVVNTILKRLREKDPEVQMIFCPTFYWGDGTEAKQRAYLEILARELDPKVYLFWTGDAVVGRITRQGAESFRRISGHRLFLWDNYPVNDDTPTMHLGPVIDRDPDLCEIVDGYMGNPHRKQNQGNRIPLATCADYAYNPSNYDPARSIGQAVLHVAEKPDQREVLRDLVEAYPGMLIWSPPQRGTGFNAVREQFDRIVALPHSRQAAVAYIEHLEHLAERMQKAFPQNFGSERETLQQDLHLLKQKLKQKFH
ncbi:MAG TPA: beta-N-acetylglucosaminidase domain-containing protein [Clostridia bacterium]|nr:beta-N-acetylglucosaminidase domain-containing protein [Clostridia bacterium]